VGYGDQKAEKSYISWKESTATRFAARGGDPAFLAPLTQLAYPARRATTGSFSAENQIRFGSESNLIFDPTYASP
jgi:hypothetical protein